MTFLELIQGGNLGLMKAADKYDGKKGFRFSTYATSWIKGSISRTIDNEGRVIRIPVHIEKQIRRIYKFKGKLTKELGREPTDEELAKELNLKLLSLKSIKKLPIDLISLDLVNIRKDSNKPKSVSDFTKNGENTLYHSNVEKEVQSQINYKILKREISKLPPIYREILELRFGLNDKAEISLKEISNKLNMTRQKIKHIEENALLMLKVQCSKEYFFQE